MMSRSTFGCTLLMLLMFIGEAVCKGGRGGGGGGGGKEIGDAAGEAASNGVSNLDLSPELTAVFSLLIVTAVFTFLQLGIALQRFKKPILPPGEPTLAYQVGKLFIPLLTLYLALFLTFNIIFAALLPTEQVGSLASDVVGLLADVPFFGMVLAIVAYRQRLQLYPEQKPFSLKSFLDVGLLLVLLSLGIARDVLTGSFLAGNFTLDIGLSLRNLYIAYEVFAFVAALDVAATSITAYIRFKKAGISDKIIHTAAIFVTPCILIYGLFRIIILGILETPATFFDLDFSALLISEVAIRGVLSIAVAGFCLGMGAPPKPPKGNEIKEVKP